MTAVLTGDNNMKSQDFVLRTQTVASEEGFRNVSKIWFDKTWTFEKGKEYIENAARSREDIQFNRADIGFSLNDKEKFVVTIDGREYRPTMHGCKSLCSWFKISQVFAVNYLESEEVDFQNILVDVFNTHKKHMGKKELLFRTYDDGTLRAVLSPTYSIVNNIWYLDLLEKLIPGGRLSHFDFSDADTIYGNVLIPDTIRKETDSEYGGMLSIGNSEIGIRSIFQVPSIFRAICMNGCIWGRKKGQEYRKKHRGFDLKIEADNIRKNLDSQIPLVSTGVDMLLDTRKLKMGAHLARIWAAVIEEHKLNREVANVGTEIYNKLGKDATAFGLVDAITRAGQEMESNVWYETDVIAGDIVRGGAKHWDVLNSRAKTMSNDRVKKLLGVAA